MNFKFNCEVCNYHSNDWSNYDKHNLTKKHSELNNTNIDYIYICEPCTFKTNDKRNFENHRKSKKHAEFNSFMVRGEWKKYSDRNYNARGWIIKEKK